MKSEFPAPKMEPSLRCRIYWFTVVVEIVNFLILVALLKYFLYDRIIGIADKREAKIAARFEEAELSRREAEKEVETFQTKQRGLDEQREQFIVQAKAEAENRRRELLEQARQEIEASSGAGQSNGSRIPFYGICARRPVTRLLPSPGIPWPAWPGLIWRSR